MSTENMEKVRVYQEKLRAEEEGRPTMRQEKVLREKKVRACKEPRNYVS